jgi:arabinose-5-phosphate isomerase
MILETGKEVIRKESQELEALARRLDENFVHAVEKILECKGRVIVTGMGKSGIIGKKIAATMTSIGISSFFLHAAEGVHGDLGMVRDDDVMIAISKSGATDELYQILPAVKRLGVEIILLTGQPDSPLAAKCDIILDCSVGSEACPNNLVPTTSTTAAMVMGDALAVALLKQRHFSAEDFAFLHPGGSLGRRLLMRVADLMHVNSEIPIVSDETKIREAIFEMTGKRLGCTLVVDKTGKLTGIFTDGDLRRLTQCENEIFKFAMSEVMIKNPKSINPEAILDKALSIMEKHSITVLPVIDRERHPVGIVHLHDILKSKLV